MTIKIIIEDISLITRKEEKKLFKKVNSLEFDNNFPIPPSRHVATGMKSESIFDRIKSKARHSKLDHWTFSMSTSAYKSRIRFVNLALVATTNVVNSAINLPPLPILIPKQKFRSIDELALIEVTSLNRKLGQRPKYISLCMGIICSNKKKKFSLRLLGWMPNDFLLILLTPTVCSQLRN